MTIYISRGIARADYVDGGRASNGWHSDISFERVPSDYTVGITPLPLHSTRLNIHSLASQDAHTSTR